MAVVSEQSADSNERSPSRLRKRRVLLTSSSHAYSCAKYKKGHLQPYLHNPPWRLLRSHLSHLVADSSITSSESVLITEWERHQAATELQRVWRGHVQRSVWWAVNGPGYLLMSIRIQRVCRGFIGRRRAVRRLMHKLSMSAAVLQGLYRGFKARQRCRSLRVARRQAAARSIQRRWRNRAARELARNRAAALKVRRAVTLQSLWRRRCGRHAAQAEQALQNSEDLQLLQYYSANSDRLHSEPHGTDQLSCVQAVHYELCACPSDFNAVWQMLQPALADHPNCAELLYAGAICLQLLWVRVGSYKVQCPHLYEQALVLLQRAWALDASRSGYTAQMRLLFTALRVSGGSSDAHLLLAVAHSSVHGAIDGAASASVAAAIAARRRRNAYRKAQWHFDCAIAASAATECGDVDLAVRCKACFTAVLQLAKGRQLRHCIVSAARSSSTSDSSGFTALATVTEHCGKLLIHCAPGRYTRNSSDSSDSSTQPPVIDTACIVVVHEDEVDMLAFAAAAQAVKAGKRRSLIEAQDHCTVAADFILPLLTLLPVTADHCSNSNNSEEQPQQQQQQQVVYRVALQFLQQHRDQTTAAATQRGAAVVLQCWWRVTLATSEASHRRLDRDQRLAEEAARAERRAAADHKRQHEASCASLIQAAVKGRQWRCKLARHRVAAALLQRAYRCHRARHAVAVLRLRAVHGPEVVTVLRGGRVISGRPVMLTVTRCGLNYRFAAADADAGANHIGYFYEREVLQLLKVHNRAAVCSKDRIGVWQHAKIVAHILACMVIASAPLAPTCELRMQAPTTALVLTQTLAAPTALCSSARTSALTRITDSNSGNSRSSCLSAVALPQPLYLKKGVKKGDRALRDVQHLVTPAYTAYLDHQALKASAVAAASGQSSVPHRRAAA
jgi:IQ calmodulin-binding motif